MADIKTAMKDWGDGARAQVTVQWANGDSGHTFIAEQRSGRTYFIDPQNGNADVSNYFAKVERGSTQFCRIDNLRVSKYINDCIRRA